MSYRRCKGTAVWGDGEIFGGLSTEVVATGAAICDKAATRRQNRVAKAVKYMIEGGAHLTKRGASGDRRWSRPEC